MRAGGAALSGQRGRPRAGCPDTPNAPQKLRTGSRVHYRRGSVPVRQVRVAPAVPRHGPSVAAAARQRGHSVARGDGGNRDARADSAASVGDRVRTSLACAAAPAAGRCGVAAGLGPGVDLIPTAARRSATRVAETAGASAGASHTAGPARPRRACHAAATARGATRARESGPARCPRHPSGGYVERCVQAVTAAPRPQNQADEDSNPGAHASWPRPAKPSLAPGLSEDESRAHRLFATSPRIAQ